MNIKHAIIGCGHIAPSHVDGCIHNNITIAACCDLDIEKAKKFADTHKIASVANSFEEVLANSSIDSVSICTDHKSHADLAIRALESGKNVIVEKPMALSVQDAERMIATAKMHHNVLTVISQHRYNRVIMEIKKAIDSGTFGAITMVNATLNSQKNKEYYTNSYWKGKLDKEGGSTLINQAIHTLDLLLWIKGLPVDVGAFGSNLKFKGIIETEDTFASIMKFADESLAILSTTNTSIDIWDSKIEVIGTKGTITFSADYPVKVIHLIHEDPEVAKTLGELLESYADKFTEPPPVSYYGTKHREQMGDFFNVVCGKSKSLFMEPEDALKTLTVVLKLYQCYR
ncbi:MAG: Gfo/Idh/MocA family oxidoreductase [Candidatus Shapirobacteria bacterium]|jgi:predicted dehydrogenase